MLLCIQSQALLAQWVDRHRQQFLLELEEYNQKNETNVTCSENDIERDFLLKVGIGLFGHNSLGVESREAIEKIA